MTSNTLAICLLHDTTKHGCNHHDAVNRNEIRLKTRCLAFLTSRFVAEHSTEDTPVFDAESKVAKAMVAQLTVQAAVSVFELFA